MNILFLTIFRVQDIYERGIYTDLIRKFKDEGHSVYIVFPCERRYHEKTTLFSEEDIHLLSVRTLNLQKTNIFEKGVATILIQYQFLKAIKNYFSDVYFDLVLYSTPPITFTKVVKYIKRRDNAKSYLLLKDIFPQNAIDLGIIKRQSLIHKYFRAKEIQLYKVSDHIGCMSKANVDFVIRNNPSINTTNLEVNPNSIAPDSSIISLEEKEAIRKKFGIPIGKRVFVYGGNLGKPQGVDFLIEILNANINTNAYFVLVGNGTEYNKIERWVKFNNPDNIILMSFLPKNDYDNLLQACDVGLIFLDRRFTIPNYPSRLLPYLENKIPVLAVTDSNTDIGKEAEENGYGFWCLNGNLKSTNEKIQLFINDSLLVKSMGEKGYVYLMQHFTVDISYSLIMSHFKSDVK